MGYHSVYDWWDGEGDDQEPEGVCAACDYPTDGSTLCPGCADIADYTGGR